jgi:type III secretion system YscD/HrpQ family protein
VSALAQRSEDGEASGAPILMLRVVAGPNTGAELHLGDGDWVIGAGSGADIIFAEPTLAQAHLRVAVRGSDVTVTALAEGVTTGSQPMPLDMPQTIPPLEPVWIGATAFAIGPTGADWPTPSAPPTPSKIGKTEAVATTPEGGPIGPPSSARRSHLWRWIGLAAGCLLLALIGAAWTVIPALGPSHAPARTPLPDKLAAAQAAIRTLGLEGQVIASRSRGFIVLDGLVPSEADRQALEASLRRARIVSDFNVVTEAHLRDMAMTVLRGFDIDPKIAATGVGQVRLTGYANDERTVVAAVRQLRADVPWIRTLDDAVVTPERARAWIEAAARDAGIAGLKVTAAPHVLTVAGVLPGDRMAVWNQISERFQTEFADTVRLNAELLPRAVEAPQGVSVGRDAYLVMPDQRRLGIGDQFGSYGRIVVIFADRVRVRAASGEIDIRYTQPPNWIVEDRDAQR